ncbi:TrkH family potassium uptake protein [Flagellimonas sp. S174]|uniref:TrkH family potassium uptake protein n=1 Tax=Flagellimonas sp. S174 TaxID=3410790 RepID=UPI003BF4DF9C
MSVPILKRFFGLYKRFQLTSSPQINLVWGFFLYTLFGFLLLMLPFFHKESVSILNHLFIATSAISTTGLVTVDIYNTYNFGGQLLVMVLFQMGGIGYMTLTTYYLLLTTQKLTRWHSSVIGAEFTIPKSIKIRDFIKSAVVFTVIMEFLGAIAFYVAFSRYDNMNLGETIWFSIFHSVSAFCTAGFSLFPNSFESFRNDGFINAIISILAISGSLGFIVITDLWYRLRKKTNSISFTTKIVLIGFLVLLTLGTLLFVLKEGTNDSRISFLLPSFFQAMTSMTTVGFNTLPIGELSLPVLLMIIFLMYIGASPSGTAGGLKITTLTAMLAVLKSRLTGQKQITFLYRKIPFERLYVATSTFILYTSIIFLFTFLLSFTEEQAFEKILFEVASALGTVGLSTGITGELSNFGKIAITVLMFLGRVGVLTFGFALLQRRKGDEIDSVSDDLAV